MQVYPSSGLEDRWFVRLVLVVENPFRSPYGYDGGVTFSDGGEGRSMRAKSRYRQSELPVVPPQGKNASSAGRRCISVIGIDHYKRWRRLRNAVGDARGVLAAFERLGFESVLPPLFDAAATADALHSLPSELEPVLEHDDSLVVFFAGHGHTTTRPYPDGVLMSRGYLIPADADGSGGKDRSWERVENWLSMIAELPPRHILVILDSCHSGIALDRSIQHRAAGVQRDGSPKPLHERRSRRVLTSALADQVARDDGPIEGHSVFTGYLIEALRGAARVRTESTLLGVNAVSTYVQHCVLESTAQQQVPGIGLLEYDDCGELFLPLGSARAVSPTQPDRARAERSRSRGKTSKPAGHAGSIGPAVRGAAPAEEPRPVRTEGWILEPAIAAKLDYQGEQRRLGAPVLSLIAGDALPAQTSWGTWAAGHGYLTLATQAMGLEAAVGDLLAQTPWLRCVPEARKRVAKVARIDVEAVDAALDARGPAQRRQWMEDLAPFDLHAKVSVWLLSWLRRATACVPDPSTAPVPAAELLAIACDLASPTAVLLFHPEPDEAWLAKAVVTAAQLIEYLPAHAVSVTAPAELATRALAEHRKGTAWTMARQGLVTVEPLARRRPGRARHTTMRALFDALECDRRTRGRFELDASVEAAEGPPIDVALVARGARIAVELDAWYHFHDPEGYRRDRAQDARLQRAGYFVLRFPAEDVDDRLASTIEQLVIALASRRAVRAPT